MSQYECPPYINNQTGELTSEKQKLDWLHASIDAGFSFLRHQRAWPDIDIGLDVINGDFFDAALSELSNVSTNRTKRQIREIVSSLGNMKIVPQHKTENKDFVGKIESLDKLWLGWWNETSADRSYRKFLQYACACGTAYFVPRWDPNFHGIGKGDIRLDVFGPRQILPIQLPANHDLQQAYAVIIVKPTPLDLARRTWPEFAERIVADREAPAGFRRLALKAQRYASYVMNRFGMGTFKEQEETPFPEVDIFECYIMDTSINTSGREIRMGDPGSSWEYTVPYLGQRLPGSAPGDFREATRQDCLMFPMRRCFVATNTCELSDGPSPFLHGKVPVIQGRVDDWPWNFLGYGMAREGAALEESNISMMRDIVDANRARLNPPFAYDSDRLTENAAAQVNPRLPGQTIPFQLGGTGSVEQIFKLLVSERIYDVPVTIPAFIKEQEARMDYQMGVTDIVAMTKAKQLPASDGLEKLIQATGPLAEDMSRGQEAVVMQLGPMITSLQFQFYSPAHVISLLGEDNAPSELFDREPGNLVPSHMPGEDKTKPSKYPNWIRYRWFGDEFTFQVTPYSLHKLNQNSRKMALFLWQKAGLPIDPWTMAEVNDIANIGPAPKGASTIIERWVAWMHLQTELEIDKLKQIAAAGIQPPGKHPGQGAGGGRPNSFKTAPTQQSKDGGARSTVRTSER